MKKNLKDILNSNKVDYAIEAHNGISAKIAEITNFDLIWASGFTIATSLGHRDCNELSWTEICHQVEYMCAATSLPILIDGDTGFGNFNNVRELIKKLCRIGVQGVCLEDKIFPKTNSFLTYNQKLTSIDDFSGKIKAAKDTQLNDDFCVIARTEGFIVNEPIEEVFKRAYAYKEAGADAILVHSKKSTIIEIEKFCNGWDYSIPIVIVPTKYSSTKASDFKRLKISLVIWANHLLRAGIFAMEKIAKIIKESQSTESIEKDIATLDKLFELVNQEELTIAATKYEK